MLHHIVDDLPTAALSHSLSQNRQLEIGQVDLSAVAINERFDAQRRQNSFAATNICNRDMYLKEDVSWHLAQAVLFIEVEDDIVTLKLILAFHPELGRR